MNQLHVPRNPHRSPPWPHTHKATYPKHTAELRCHVGGCGSFQSRRVLALVPWRRGDGGGVRRPHLSPGETLCQHMLPEWIVPSGQRQMGKDPNQRKRFFLMSLTMNISLGWVRQSVSSAWGRWECGEAGCGVHGWHHGRREGCCGITEMWELSGREVWRRTTEFGILFLALITALVTSSHMRGMQAGGSVREQWHLLRGMTVCYEVLVAFNAGVAWEMWDAFLVVRRCRCMKRLEQGAKQVPPQGFKAVAETQLRRLCE